jgi:hypothetical protein
MTDASDAGWGGLTDASVAGWRGWGSTTDESLAGCPKAVTAQKAHTIILVKSFMYTPSFVSEVLGSQVRDYILVTVVSCNHMKIMI